MPSGTISEVSKSRLLFVSVAPETTGYLITDRGVRA